MAPNLPEYAVLFHGVAMAGGTITTINPTYTAPEVHHQLTDAGASLLVTIPLFLEVAAEGAEGTDVEAIFVLGEATDGAASVLELFGEPLAEPVAVDPLRRRGGAAVLVGHHRPVQGRDAHAPQPGRQHRPGARCDEPGRRRRRHGGAAVLPHLRHAGADEHRPARRGDDRHDAALRPAGVPVAAPAVRRHPLLRGAPDRGRARQAPDRRRVRPVPRAAVLLRAPRPCRPSSRRRPRAGSAARSCRATG